MKEKLKVFGLGFFSNKIADKAQNGGFGLFFINVTLALLVILFGTVLVETLSFYPRYSAANDFKATVNGLFDGGNGDAISLLVGENGTVTARRGDGEYGKNVFADTFLSEEDRKAYSIGGYNVVVDTRDVNLYAEFTAYCVSASGAEISYEDYLALSEAEKSGYAFKIRYTPNEVDLTDGKTAERENYLSEKGGAALEDLGRLKADLTDGKIDERAYKNGVWALYVKNYYPELTEYEKTSYAPLVRNYYFHNYTLKGEKNYLFVFSDSVVGSFTTSDGKTEEFYGFYEKFPVGEITDGKDFIETVFSSSVGISEYVAFSLVMRFLPIYLVMPIVAALIAYLIVKIGEREKPKRFSSVFKITATFVLWSAIFAAVIAYLISFFIERTLAFTVVTVSFFAVLMIRSIVWFVSDVAAYRRSQENNNSPTQCR